MTDRYNSDMAKKQTAPRDTNQRAKVPVDAVIERTERDDPSGARRATGTLALKATDNQVVRRDQLNPISGKS